MPLPLLKKQSRDYLIQLVEGLQIQLRMVESRLVCNNKLRVISSNERLFEKYVYYYQVLDMLY